jgi:hypothetical protein
MKGRWVDVRTELLALNISKNSGSAGLEPRVCEGDGGALDWFV